MQSPILSICVPTYNRADLLHVSFGELLQQHDDLDDLRGHVEVVVVDNASTDHTPDITRSFFGQYPGRFILVRRESTIGPANALLCTSYATGTYILILSDDDILLPNALRSLLGTLISHPEIDALSINMCGFERSPGDGFRTFRRDFQVVATTREILLRELGTMITFLSAIVYRRSVVNVEDYAALLDTHMPQAYAFMDVLIKGSNFALMGEPLLACRINNSGAYNYTTVFFDQFFDLLDSAHDGGLPLALIRELKRIHLRRSIAPMLVHFRTHGSFGALKIDWRSARRALVVRYWRISPVTLIAVLLLSVLPTRSVATLRTLWRAFNSDRRKGGRDKSAGA